MWCCKTPNVFPCAGLDRVRGLAIFNTPTPRHIYPTNNSTYRNSSKEKSVEAKSSTQAKHPRVRDNVSSKNKISIDFDQTKEAYKSKHTLELLRSLLVFKLCSYDFLVDKNQEIMDLGKKVLGVKAFEQLMKMTFYGQFVAGEDHEAIRPLIQRNRAFGVGAVLDYSVEEDLSQEEAERKEMESCWC